MNLFVFLLSAGDTDNPLYAGLIGAISAIFFSIIFGIIGLVKSIRRKQRIKNFRIPEDAEAYTCPACGLSNALPYRCEKCGFDPYATLSESDDSDETNVPSTVEENFVQQSPSVVTAKEVGQPTNASKKRKVPAYRSALGWVVSISLLVLLSITVICAIAFLVVAGNQPFDTFCAYAAGGVSLLGVVLHSAFHMRKILCNAIVSLCISFTQSLISFFAGVLYLNAAQSFFYFSGNTLYQNEGLNILGTIGWIVSWITIIAHLYYLVSSILRIVKGDHLSEESFIRLKEKTYEKIERYHSYWQKGIISEEEYNENRSRLLRELEFYKESSL